CWGSRPPAIARSDHHDIGGGPLVNWIRKKRHSIPLAFLGAGLIFAIVAVFTPWPAALFIRALFTDGANKTIAEMNQYAPDASKLDSKIGVQYAPGGSDTQLDWYAPKGSTGPLPTLVWIHG